jgi:hypothetical protein
MAVSSWVVLDDPATPVGRLVSVQGLLQVGSSFTTRVGCPAMECCNRVEGTMVLAGAARTLKLAGLQCRGDESAMCCDFPVGTMVVASGRFEKGGLTDVSLCAMD